MLKAASGAWNTLDVDEKEQYASHDEMAVYQEELQQYRDVMNAMKQPAGAFGLFVQDHWQKLKAKVCYLMLSEGLHMLHQEHPFS